ncbi:Valacyclovir hydrolase [Fusarium oxysporum f. sp. albedinis]|nr:Valacyclovir hydrolase [Fusarium oxysporum f. sp. albedinis]
MQRFRIPSQYRRSEANLKGLQLSFGYDLKFQESLSHVDDDEESLLGHHRETGDGMPVTLVSAFLGPSSGDRRVSRFRSTALMSDIWRDKRTEDAAQVYDMSYLSVSLAWNKRRSRRWKMLKAGVLWGLNVTVLPVGVACQRSQCLCIPDQYKCIAVVEQGPLLYLVLVLLCFMAVGANTYKTTEEIADAADACTRPATPELL